MDPSTVGPSELVEGRTVTVLKDGGLTREERALFDKHPGIGAGILGHIRKVDPVVQAVLHHHERWDGGGYPDELAGERIPLLARIIHVADAYDAMTRDRPHRSAITPMAALRELQRCCPSGYDADCVAALAEVVHLPKLEEAFACV